jgi:hypothetical protein
MLGSSVTGTVVHFRPYCPYDPLQKQVVKGISTTFGPTFTTISPTLRPRGYYPLRFSGKIPDIMEDPLYRRLTKVLYAFKAGLVSSLI